MNVPTQGLLFAQAASRLEMIETFLRLHVNVLWRITIQSAKVRDYDRLHGAYNDLLAQAQRAGAYVEENDHLYRVLSDLLEENKALLAENERLMGILENQYCSGVTG